MRKKTRQKAENKHNFDLTVKTEIDEKTRQNTENKQTFEFDEKMKLREKLVKTLKINKLLP